jgi:2-polyprenyl-3-methyl-5-hydroxy-6-metoxy-1,4-benzoquinol methylase
MPKFNRLEKDPEGKRVINKTQLYVDKAAERGIFHRDIFAHALRYTHVFKFMSKLRNREEFCILDVGCGDFPLLRTAYTNKVKPKYYLGLDARNMSGKEGVVPNFEHEFMQCDFIDGIPECKYGKWDMIVFLEVIEHVSKENGIKILENIKKVMNPETYFFISTPCFAASSGIAENHTYEWEYEELKGQLESMFTVEAHYGTFASQRDIEKVMSECEREIYERLKEYYDSNFVSILLAPIHPAQSRNCIWRCRIKS